MKLKNGDKVIIIANSSCSSNKVGDIGIISSYTKPYNSFKVEVVGSVTTGNWTYKEDVELVKAGEEVTPENELGIDYKSNQSHTEVQKMIKGIYIKNEIEKNFIENDLINKGISTFNIYFNKGQKILSWFENEDYQNTNIGFNLIEVH